MRAKFLAHFGGWAQDVVFAAPQADFVCAMIFPNVEACRELCQSLPNSTPLSDLLQQPQIRETFQLLLDQFAAQSTGSSTCVMRAILLEQPASIDHRELTDKGSINQKTVLENRAAIVRELFETGPSARTLEITKGIGAVS